jgi:hypothetical protein
MQDSELTTLSKSAQPSSPNLPAACCAIVLYKFSSIGVCRALLNELRRKHKSEVEEEAPECGIGGTIQWIQKLPRHPSVTAELDLDAESPVDLANDFFNLLAAQAERAARSVCAPAAATSWGLGHEAGTVKHAKNQEQQEMHDSTTAWFVSLHSEPALSPTRRMFMVSI